MDLKPIAESDQAAFFEGALSAALKAEAVTRVICVPIEVAGCRIELRFASPRLRDALLPALQHNVVATEGEPSAVVHLWDGVSSGIRMVSPPCSSRHFTDRGDIWGFNSRRYRAAFHFIECAVNVIDLESRQAVYWVHDTVNMPYWAKASPLRTILHWILEREGAQLLHAAAVGDELGAVLITGKGGVGKSTTALTALEHGLKYVGDDYLAVRLDPTPTVISLYCTAKLSAEDIGKFPRLAPHVTSMPSEEGEKAVIQLHPVLGQQIERSMPLRALLTPRVVRQNETDFEPVDAMNLRRAATFTTLSQLPYAGQQAQNFIECLIARLPGFTIRLGQNPEKVAGAILDLLAKKDCELKRANGDEPSTLAELPFISVIIPIFNGADFLCEAIDNVLTQEYPCLEIIIVDDGSTDDIEAAVAALPIDVRFFKQANAGPAAARNRGIRDAAGTLIAFLDVDDLWPPKNLRDLAARFVEDTELMVSTGFAQIKMLDQASGHYMDFGKPEEVLSLLHRCRALPARDIRADRSLRSELTIRRGYRLVQAADRKRAQLGTRAASFTVCAPSRKEYDGKAHAPRAPENSHACRQARDRPKAACQAHRALRNRRRRRAGLQLFGHHRGAWSSQRDCADCACNRTRHQPRPARAYRRRSHLTRHRCNTQHEQARDRFHRRRPITGVRNNKARR